VKVVSFFDGKITVHLQISSKFFQTPKELDSLNIAYECIKGNKFAKRYVSCYIESHTERTVLLKDLKFFSWIHIGKVILLNYQNNYVETLSC